MSFAQQLLRRNSPQQTEIRIHLDEEDVDSAIAQALEQNQYVSHVWLRPSRRNANWGDLYRVIATRGNLVHFTLFDNYDLLPRSRSPAEKFLPILQATQQNTSIRVVAFRWCTLEAGDFCSFLDASVHVTDLMLDHCDFTGGTHGERDIAAALQRNTNIVTLKLSGVIDFLATILEGLVLNICVRNIFIEQNASFSEATSTALNGLLESSTGSIQHLELCRITFYEESFRPVAQGLINGRTVTHITLAHCNFQCAGSVHVLNDILERKQNLRSLAIKNCIFHSWLQSFLQALFSSLCRQDSPLRYLQFRGMNIDHRFSYQSLRSLCEAIAASQLESFAIGTVGNQIILQIFADFIPYP